MSEWWESAMRKSGLRVNASRSPGYSTFSAAGELPRRFSGTNLARRPPSSADVDVGDPPAPRYTSSAVRGRCAAESAARAWRRSRALGAKSRRFRGLRRRWLSSVSSRRSSRRSSSRYSSVCKTMMMTIVVGQHWFTRRETQRDCAALQWTRADEAGGFPPQLRRGTRRDLQSAVGRSTQVELTCMKRNTSSETSASRVAPAGALHTSSAASSARGACSEKK